MRGLEGLTGCFANQRGGCMNLNVYGPTRMVCFSAVCSAVESSLIGNSLMCL
jgi:hypothetical protein